jgi:Ni,Fe-hydrogenase maturation factor
MKILVFGNPLVKSDSLPLELLPALRQAFPSIEFKEFDAVEDLEDEGESLVILDSVHGIEKVKLFDEIDSFEDSPRYSLHDFDLLSYLKLLKKIGSIESVTIIGVPEKGNKKKVMDEISEAIRRLENGKTNRD